MFTQIILYSFTIFGKAVKTMNPATLSRSLCKGESLQTTNGSPPPTACLGSVIQIFTNTYAAHWVFHNQPI